MPPRAGRAPGRRGRRASALTTSPNESSGCGRPTRSRLASCRRIDAFERWSSGLGSIPSSSTSVRRASLVGLERLRLSPRAVEREHQLSRAAARAAGAPRRAPRARRSARACRPSSSSASIRSSSAASRSSSSRRISSCANVLVREVRERRAAPERQRLARAVASRARRADPRARPTSRSNRGQIELLGLDPEQVAGRLWSRASPARAPCGAARRSSGARSPPSAAGARPRASSIRRSAETTSFARRSEQRRSSARCFWPAQRERVDRRERLRAGRGCGTRAHAVCSTRHRRVLARPVSAPCERL